MNIPDTDLKSSLKDSFVKLSLLLPSGNSSPAKVEVATPTKHVMLAYRSTVHNNRLFSAVSAT
jgi:hypothetical protein